MSVDQISGLQCNIFIESAVSTGSDSSPTAAQVSITFPMAAGGGMLRTMLVPLRICSVGGGFVFSLFVKRRSDSELRSETWSTPPPSASVRPQMEWASEWVMLWKSGQNCPISNISLLSPVTFTAIVTASLRLSSFHRNGRFGGFWLNFCAKKSLLSLSQSRL